MNNRAVQQLAAAVAFVVILAWGMSIIFDLQMHTIKNAFSFEEQINPEDAAKKCSLPRSCPPETFAFHIWSGAANVIGPKICFDGKNIMSHVLNNIGPGLNIVIIDGKDGVVEKSYFLNMISGDSEHILKYLKAIEPGKIVLVATFDDVTPKITDEIKEVLAGMGSTLIKSVKHRDNWVFAGIVGAKENSLYEKLSENDPKTNIYQDWPHLVEVGGCFLKSQIAEDKMTGSPEMKGKI